MLKPKKILVALSGGVDSAVAAALLKKQGYDVVGVFFRFFGPTWKPNFQVERIANKLNIPLKVVDARGEFQKKVIDYFIAEYRAGLTPNPCIVCNKEMKFRLLFDLMRKEKADYVATGHYARIRIQPFIQGRTLCEAKDKSKDQSYFLYRLSQKDLAKIIFPLGEYKKTEVKKIAKKMKLLVQKEESQDVCFFGHNDLNKYLNKYLKISRGEIVDDSGKILGYHRGLHFYTIGQRKGVKIGGIGPFWVIGKNARKNELLVSRDPKKLFTRKFQIANTNWISPKIKFPLKAKVQIRYRAEKVRAIIKKPSFAKAPEGKPGKLAVETDKYLRAVTAGQSAVFYRGGEVIGGGIIISHE